MEIVEEKVDLIKGVKDMRAFSAHFFLACCLRKQMM